jgi:hypothetical protein
MRRKTLTSKQLQVAILLSRGMPKVDASKLAGCTTQSINNWERNVPAFNQLIDELAELEVKSVSQAIDAARMKAYTVGLPMAVDVLIAAMGAEKTNSLGLLEPDWTNRVKAALAFVTGAPVLAEHVPSGATAQASVIIITGDAQHRAEQARELIEARVLGGGDDT